MSSGTYKGEFGGEQWGSYYHVLNLEKGLYIYNNNYEEMPLQLQVSL
jgi:hypothetical protein